MRAVGGLTTAEIANAFLVPEATMAQRISRAKQRIKTSGVPFRLPTDADRSERLSAVLHVLYLIFNEGYSSSIGASLQRRDLAIEAIRLTRAVRNLLGDGGDGAGEVVGPAGAHAPDRCPARGAHRTARRADSAHRTGSDALGSERHRRGRGDYHARRCRAARSGPISSRRRSPRSTTKRRRAEDTDWPQILALYGLLKRMSDNPMVTLNHAIATAMVSGPPAGLQLLEALDADPRMAGHYRLDAVRGHLHEMAGNPAAAIAHYRAAAGRTTSIPERNYLATRAARLADLQH